MIDLKQITLHRGGKTLLSAFDLTVNSGEAVQLKGPMGLESRRYSAFVQGYSKNSRVRPLCQR